MMMIIIIVITTTTTTTTKDRHHPDQRDEADDHGDAEGRAAPPQPGRSKEQNRHNDTHGINDNLDNQGARVTISLGYTVYFDTTSNR